MTLARFQQSFFVLYNQPGNCYYTNTGHQLMTTMNDSEIMVCTPIKIKLMMSIPIANSITNMRLPIK